MSDQESKQIEELKAKVVRLQNICKELEKENSELKHTLEVTKAMYYDAKNQFDSFDRIMKSRNTEEIVAFYMTNHQRLNDMQLQDLLIKFPEISRFIITEQFESRSVNIMLDKNLYQGFAGLPPAKICDFIRQLNKNNIKTFSFGSLFEVRELDENLGKALTQLLLEETIVSDWFYGLARKKEWFKPFEAKFREKYKTMVETYEEYFDMDEDDLQY